MGRQMTQSFCALSGNAVTRAELVFPYVGVWTADVWLDKAAGLSGNVTLELGGLSLAGNVFRGGEYAGADSYRIVGGFGGWKKAVRARSYTHEVGLKLSTVVGDVAKEVGETVSVLSDATIGTWYVRQTGPASRVFGQLGIDWRVLPSGTTSVGLPTGSAVSAKFDVISYDARASKASIATEDPAEFVPGNTLSLAGRTVTIATSCMSLDKGAFRIEVFGT